MLKNLLIWLIVVVLCFLIFWISIRLYTQHGEEILVPNVVGMPLSLVKKTLSDSKLTYSVGDTIFNAIVPTGLIAYQHPPPHTKVKRGRTIQIAPSSLIVQENIFPDIVGQNLRMASFRLNEAQILVRDTSWSDSGLFGIVLGQQLDGEELFAGTTLKPTDSITLIVGTKNTALIQVPNLIGVSRIEARIILQSRYLRLGEVLQTGDNGEAITHQDPQPLDSMGNLNKVAENTPINVWLE